MQFEEQPSFFIADKVHMSSESAFGILRRVLQDFWTKVRHVGTEISSVVTSKFSKFKKTGGNAIF